MFLILIAVVLFACLSYVVAMATRGTGGDGHRENTSLRASQILQYATYTEQAILRMRFRNIDAENFCFDNDNWGHTDYYHSGCDDEKNRIFSTNPASGNVAWTSPPVDANDGSPWYFPADICIAGLGKDVRMDCNNDGTGDSEDLVMILPNIDKAVCIDINKQLDIENPDGVPPKASASLFSAGMPKFTGSFADGTVISSAGSDPAILRTRQQGCVEGNSTPATGTYHYFHSLLPR